MGISIAVNPFLRGKFRSNVREISSTKVEKMAHFSITTRSKVDGTELVENIFLTGKIREYALKNLKKGVIATVFYEYRQHSWMDDATNQERSEMKKFATFIKPNIKPSLKVEEDVNRPKILTS